MLSTGSAARMCGVKPDTVLKWVRAGRLRATRTAGGHCRIDPADLQPFLKGPENPPLPIVAEDALLFRCWDLMSRGGELPSTCRDCVVYTSGATRCWALREHLELACALAGDFQNEDCSHCVVFDRALHGVVRVLLVTQDAALTARLQVLECPGYEIRVAPDGYVAAATLCDYPATLAVVDAESLREEPKLVESLLSHRRARGMRVVIAGKPSRRRPVAGGERMSIPRSFGWEDIRRLLSQVHGCQGARSAP